MENKTIRNKGRNITEIDLFYENIPKIAALIMEMQQMTNKQYQEFKAESLKEVRNTYIFLCKSYRIRLQVIQSRNMAL